MLDIKEIFSLTDARFSKLTPGQEIELGSRLKVLREDQAFRYHLHLIAEQYIENQSNLLRFRPGSPESKGDDNFYRGVLEGLSLALDTAAAIVDRAEQLTRDQEPKELR